MTATDDPVTDPPRARGPVELVAVPDEGRVVRLGGVVRLADVDADGRMRLDGVARHLQDISRDDTRSAEVDRADVDAWVVRRTTVVVHRPLRFDEPYEAATFCGGTGARWAERRISITQDGGGHVEAASLWIAVDPTTGRPRRVSEAFTRIWAPAAQGRRVSARRTTPDAPEGEVGVEHRPWPLRRSDVDILDHVNNAAHWQAVDDEAARRGMRPVWAELEHVDEVRPGDDVTLTSAPLDAAGSTLGVWLRVGDRLATAAVVGVATGR